MNKRKVLVIGLDSAEPSLIYQWRKKLPTFSALMGSGAHGTLRSSIPAITVPAWTCMTTGVDPGTLGFYDFRNRSAYDYHSIEIISSRVVTYKRLWDLLSETGLKSTIVGIPPTYPVTNDPNITMVSDFLTPGIEKEYTNPPELAGTISRWLEHDGAYEFDVGNYRTPDKLHLRDRIYEVTAKHFKVLHGLMGKEWDFFMFNEIGLDRIQHVMWQFMDTDDELKDAVFNYYYYLDFEMQKLLAAVPEDTAILVVSDHGAQKAQGFFRINEWLAREGYLELNSRPTRPTPFDKCDVDWEHTLAWAHAGFWARIYVNLSGREPFGPVWKGKYEEFLTDLADKLTSLPEMPGTVCYRPKDVYMHTEGFPPDLIVYPGNLSWRALGSMGYTDIFTQDNDTGPDGSNHARDGIVIIKDPQDDRLGDRCIYDSDIRDITPTVLSMFDVPVPNYVQGKSLV